MNERLCGNIERTIGHVSRQIRRESEVDSKTVVALARLIRSYSSLLEKTEEKEWDYEMDGNPFIHSDYKERELRRRTEEEAEKLGLNLDELEDDDEDENENDDD